LRLHMLMSSKHEGTVDQWQRGSVTPPDHSLRRNRGVPSRSEKRVEDPAAAHQEPSGRELRRAADRKQAKEAEPGKGGD
jgi:hypothetical protein